MVSLIGFLFSWNKYSWATDQSCGFIGILATIEYNPVTMEHWCSWKYENCTDAKQPNEIQSNGSLLEALSWWFWISLTQNKNCRIILGDGRHINHLNNQKLRFIQIERYEAITERTQCNKLMVVKLEKKGSFNAKLRRNYIWHYKLTFSYSTGNPSTRGRCNHWLPQFLCNLISLNSNCTISVCRFSILNFNSNGRQEKTHIISKMTINWCQWSIRTIRNVSIHLSQTLSV